MKEDKEFKFFNFVEAMNDEGVLIRIGYSSFNTLAIMSPVLNDKEVIHISLEGARMILRAVEDAITDMEKSHE